MATERDKGYKVIAPDRFLTTRTVEGTVTVKLGAKQIVTSSTAVFLEEGERAPVAYIAKADLSTVVLVPTDTQYWCRWKGNATYFDIEFETSRVANGAWQYPEAPEDLQVLQDRIAFDANIFQIEIVEGQAAQAIATEPGATEPVATETEDGD